MWLPGRLVYCAGNKGTVVPGLLKCLGVWPLPCAGGWSTLGSRPGGGTLLRNASSSIALCLGLGCPPPPRLALYRGVCGALLPLHCCLCSVLSRVVRGGGALLSPQKEPHHRCQALLPVLFQGMGLQCR